MVINVRYWNRLLFYMYFVLNKCVKAFILYIFSRHFFRNSSNSDSRVFFNIDVI